MGWDFIFERGGGSNLGCEKYRGYNWIGNRLIISVYDHDYPDALRSEKNPGYKTEYELGR